MALATLRTVRSRYDRFRKRYFKNYNLPPASEVKFSWIESPETYGEASAEEIPPVIELDISLKPHIELLCVTLLHEMVHIAYPGEIGHGDYFKKEMRRLESLGVLREFF